MKSIKNYLSESFSEIRKVSWPTKADLVRISLTVLVIGSLSTLLIGALDSIFNYGYKLLLDISANGGF